MSPALQAAFRLAITLPSKVHRRPDPQPKHYVAHGRVPEEKLKEMRELEKTGMPRKKMAKILRMSPDTLREKMGSRNKKNGGKWGGWKCKLRS